MKSLFLCIVIFYFIYRIKFVLCFRYDRYEEAYNLDLENDFYYTDQQNIQKFTQEKENFTPFRKTDFFDNRCFYHTFIEKKRRKNKNQDSDFQIKYSLKKHLLDWYNDFDYIYSDKKYKIIENRISADSVDISDKIKILKSKLKLLVTSNINLNEEENQNLSLSNMNPLPFVCRNKMYISQEIERFKVNDSQCDCLDGSDETSNNSCKELNFLMSYNFINKVERNIKIHEDNAFSIVYSKSLTKILEDEFLYEIINDFSRIYTHEEQEVRDKLRYYLLQDIELVDKINFSYSEFKKSDFYINDYGYLDKSNEDFNSILSSSNKNLFTYFKRIIIFYEDLHNSTNDLVEKLKNMERYKNRLEDIITNSTEISTLKVNEILNYKDKNNISLNDISTAENRISGLKSEINKIKQIIEFKIIETLSHKYNDMLKNKKRFHKLSLENIEDKKENIKDIKSIQNNIYENNHSEESSLDQSRIIIMNNLLKKYYYVDVEENYECRISMHSESWCNYKERLRKKSDSDVENPNHIFIDLGRVVNFNEKGIITIISNQSCKYYDSIIITKIYLKCSTFHKMVFLKKFKNNCRFWFELYSPELCNYNDVYMIRNFLNTKY